MSNASKKTTIDDVWEVIKELGESQKELGESQKKTDLQLQKVGESQKELGESQKKTDLQLQKMGESQEELRESQKELRESQEKTDLLLQEVGELQKATDRQMKKTDARFESQWGKLIESLVEGDLVKKLNEWEIPVHYTSSNIEGTFEGQSYEYDIIAVNGDQVVVVEVKTVLKTRDVDCFIKKLKTFKKFFPRYSKDVIHGAVAYIKADTGAAKYSEKQGLFVIRATGNSSKIVNEKGFSPKGF